MEKTFHFVAGFEDGIWIAICLEHDLATQAVSRKDLKEACSEVIEMTWLFCSEEGLDPSFRIPPPDHAISDIRSLPEAFEFALDIQLP